MDRGQTQIEFNFRSLLFSPPGSSFHYDMILGFCVDFYFRAPAWVGRQSEKKKPVSLLQLFMIVFRAHEKKGSSDDCSFILRFSTGGSCNYEISQTRFFCFKFFFRLLIDFIEKKFFSFSHQLWWGHSSGSARPKNFLWEISAVRAARNAIKPSFVIQLENENEKKIIWMGNNSPS